MVILEKKTTCVKDAKIKTAFGSLVGRSTLQEQGCLLDSERTISIVLDCSVLPLPVGQEMCMSRGTRQ